MRTGLVYHTGALGDLIVAVPAVQQWARDLSIKRLVLLGRGHPGELLKTAAIVCELWDASAAWFACAYRGARPLLPEPIDAALAFTAPGGPIEQALSAAISGPVTTVRPVPSIRQPIVRHHLRAVGAEPVDGRAPALMVPVQPHSDQRVAIAPGSGSTRKNWPLDRFGAVAKALRLNATIMWLLGPAEENLCPPVANDDLIVHSQPIESTAQEISSCAVLLGNDSGLCHLAAALSVPVVVLFAVTDAAVWAPASPVAPVLVVTPSSIIPGNQCETLPPPSADASMDGIAVAPVINACRRLLP